MSRLALTIRRTYPMRLPIDRIQAGILSVCAQHQSQPDEVIRVIHQSICELRRKAH